jgi:hypothetical protein
MERQHVEDRTLTNSESAVRDDGNERLQQTMQELQQQLEERRLKTVTLEQQETQKRAVTTALTSSRSDRPEQRVSAKPSREQDVEEPLRRMSRKKQDRQLRIARREWRQETNRLLLSIQEECDAIFRRNELSISQMSCSASYDESAANSPISKSGCSESHTAVIPEHLGHFHLTAQNDNAQSMNSQVETVEFEGQLHDMHDSPGATSAAFREIDAQIDAAMMDNSANQALLFSPAVWQHSTSPFGNENTSSLARSSSTKEDFPQQNRREHWQSMQIDLNRTLDETEALVRALLGEGY